MLDLLMTAFMSVVVASVFFQFFEFMYNLSKKINSNIKYEEKKVLNYDDLLFDIESSLDLSLYRKTCLKEELNKLFGLREQIFSLKGKMEHTPDYLKLSTMIDKLIYKDFLDCKRFWSEGLNTNGTIVYDNLIVEADKLRTLLKRIPDTYFIEDVFEGDVSSTVLSKSLTKNSDKLKLLLNNTLITEEDKELIQKQIEQINTYLTEQKDKVNNTTVGEIRNDLQVNQKYLDSLKVFWLD